MHHRRHNEALDNAPTDRPRRLRTRPARTRMFKVALPLLFVGGSMAAAPALATTSPLASSHR